MNEYKQLHSEIESFLKANRKPQNNINSRSHELSEEWWINNSKITMKRILKEVPIPKDWRSNTILNNFDLFTFRSYKGFDDNQYLWFGRRIITISDKVIKRDFDTFYPGNSVEEFSEASRLFSNTTKLINQLSKHPERIHVEQILAVLQKVINLQTEREHHNPYLLKQSNAYLWLNDNFQILLRYDALFT